MQTFTQSPLDDEFVQNPYPFYERARAAGDLFYWSDYKRVCAISHRAVNAFLRERNWGREIPKELRRPPPPHLEPFARLELTSMLELDPPEHTRLRRLVNRAFTSRNIAELEPEIDRLARDLLEPSTGDEFELMHGFAERLPVLVIARLLGVPDEMAGQFLSWSHAMVAMYQANRNLEIEKRAAAALDRASAEQPDRRSDIDADRGRGGWRPPLARRNRLDLHPPA